MPGAGAVQVTAVAACWRQLEGGSCPFASGDSFASFRAASSGLTGILGPAGDDDMAMAGSRRGWDPEPAAVRTQPTAPAASRASAARTVSTRGLDGLDGLRGRRAGGAGGWFPPVPDPSGRGPVVPWRVGT